MSILLDNVYLELDEYSDVNRLYKVSYYVNSK